MASGQRGAAFGLGPFLLAVATLFLPLAGIVLGALAQPPASISRPPSVAPGAPDQLSTSSLPSPTVDSPLPVASLPAAAAEVPPLPDPPPEAVPDAVIPEQQVAAVAAPLPPPSAAEVPLTADAREPVTEPAEPFPNWMLENSLNFLLVGVDRRAPGQVALTDTIMLGLVDLGARRATVISIPRDLVVRIPGFASDRINAAYALGETRRTPGGGPALLRATVEQNFRLPVHHHAVVDFGCFRGTIDALGGITVTVPRRIHDPRYPTDDYGYKVVTFEPGPQQLDSQRALEYARTRHADSDFGRMRRQQQVLTAIKEQALQVRSLSALPKVIEACRGLSSDLSLLQLVALGAAVREIQPSALAFRVIDERMTQPHRTRSGAAVLLPRWDRIHALLGQTSPAS
jgi:LCP family protein required for cell wall assembly